MQNEKPRYRTQMNSASDQSIPYTSRSSCGRTGCIAIYRTDNCHLCDAAGDFLKTMLKEEGLSEKIIKVIEQDVQLGEVNFDEILSRPAIRVCDTVVTGLPDDEKMRNTLRYATSLKCFSKEPEQ
ncbi:MAG: hypothetical protein ACFFF4_01890 [Candidatus Thorarchaeota archaeon]